MYTMGRVERSVSEFRDRGHTGVEVRPSVCVYLQGSRKQVASEGGGSKRIGKAKQKKLDQTIAPGGFRIQEHPALTEHEREETSSRLDRNAECGNTRPLCEKKTRRAALAQLRNFSRVYDDAREQTK